MPTNYADAQKEARRMVLQAQRQAPKVRWAGTVESVRTRKRPEGQLMIKLEGTLEIEGEDMSAFQVFKPTLTDPLKAVIAEFVLQNIINQLVVKG